MIWFYILGGEEEIREDSHETKVAIVVLKLAIFCVWAAPKQRELGFEKVVSRYKRFARSYRSMNPTNFSDTPNVKFLKCRQFYEEFVS